MTPYYADPLVTLYLGDCLEVMPTLEAESVDAVVTDPPYGLGFMGKVWDHGVPATPFWAEMYRVAKPGAYLLAFGGTRTIHRIATNIEDAGWIIRDMLMWIYASGFPKGKANLKPAHEPIVLARKPGPLRPLAIDECRIGLGGSEAVDDREGEPTADTRYGDKVRAKPGRRLVVSNRRSGNNTYGDGLQGSKAAGETSLGRWPSNVLLGDPELFDEPNPWVVGSGATSDSASSGTWGNRHDGDESYRLDGRNDVKYGDSGGYSRFFIVPKADRTERERGLAGHPKQIVDIAGQNTPEGRAGRGVTSEYQPRANVHPTVKPIDLMRHLVRLVTPPGGVVLDPFLGSGSTALAASEEGFRCIGIERESEYLEIAKGRLMATPMGLGLDTPISQRRIPYNDDKSRWPTRETRTKRWTEWRETTQAIGAVSSKDNPCTCDHERPDGEHRPSPGCLMCEWCDALSPPKAHRSLLPEVWP